MCGILGSVNINFNHEELSLISHRGPDSNGVVDFDFNHHIVKLAHCRLAIVDLSEAGNQPMLSYCGNYCIILNGEIYNHLQLREKIHGINYKGHSDTETILYYIIEYGIKSIKDFNGIFAFAFCDKKKGRIFLARDKYGVKPLYHYSEGGKFLFSSEIRPMRKLIELSLDEDSLNLLLNLRYIPSPNTLFKNIKKLRPGHYAEIDLSCRGLKFNIKPYISNKYKPLNIPFNEAVKEYGILLKQAVDRQLMSDVEVGILLSGGIDSAVIAGIAAEKLPYKPKSFTVGFDSTYHVNEIEYARETARHFGLEHYSVKISLDNFFDIFEECSRIVEEPLATTSFIPMYYLSKLASENVKVVLTGQGADEPLGGYGRYQGEILHQRLPYFILRAATSLLRLSSTKDEQLIRGANALRLKNDIERFVEVYSLFRGEEIKSLTGSSANQSATLIKYYYDLLGCSSFSTSTERMMAIDMYMNLADDLLLYTDKITMNFSLECRVPMLDLPLIDFLESLPQSYKVRLGKTKIIHKKFAKIYLPKEIINRPKLGFQSPTDIWFRKEFNRIKEVLLYEGNPALKYLNKAAIENTLKMHKNGYNKEKQIFLLLSLTHWFSSIK